MKKFTFSNLILIVLLSIAYNTVYAQESSFSQPFANPLNLNPAFAGAGSSERIGLNYRNEWTNYQGGGNPALYNVSFDRNIIDSNNGIGLLASMDKMGFVTTDNVSLIYAHQFHIKSFNISVGVQGTYINIGSEGAYLAPDGGGPAYLPNNTSMAGFSAGVLGYGKHYFFGFSAANLTQPIVSPIGEMFWLPPIEYTGFAGAMIPVGIVTISPTIILYEQQQGWEQEALECYVTIWHITAGIGYRPQDATIFMLGYQGKLLRIGYSYDYSIYSHENGVNESLTGGTNEFSLAVLLPYTSPKLKKTGGINCPAF